MDIWQLFSSHTAKGQQLRIERETDRVRDAKSQQKKYKEKKQVK